ncbi:MAG: hypothetical protein QXV57_08930 [Thermoproteota archaeon]
MIFVIGDPVHHSLSPPMHNRALRKLGIDSVYLALRVPGGMIPSFSRQGLEIL